MAYDTDMPCKELVMEEISDQVIQFGSELLKNEMKRLEQLWPVAVRGIFAPTDIASSEAELR